MPTVVILPAMPLHGVADDLWSPRRRHRRPPPRKAAETTYALRLWAAREYRAVTVEELTLLGAGHIADLNNLASDRGRDHGPGREPAALTPPIRRRLDQLAACLAVDPAWLRGEGETDHAALAEQERLGRHLLAEGAVGVSSDDEGVGTPDAVAVWLDTLDAVWQRLLAQSENNRVQSRITDLLPHPDAAGKPWPEFHRRQLVAMPDLGGVRPAPASGLFTPGQLATLAPVLGCPDVPDLALIAAAVARRPSRPPVPTRPADPDIPWAITLAFGSEPYPRLFEALRQRRHEHDEHTEHMDEEVAEVRLRSLLHWAFVTVFPGEPRVPLDHAITIYRAWRTQMLANIVPPDAGITEEPMTRHIAQARRQYPELGYLLDQIEGRIVRRDALVEALELVAGTAADDLLRLLIQADVVRVPTRGGPFVLLTDGDDRARPRASGPPPSTP